MWLLDKLGRFYDTYTGKGILLICAVGSLVFGGWVLWPSDKTPTGTGDDSSVVAVENNDVGGSQTVIGRDQIIVQSAAPNGPAAPEPAPSPPQQSPDEHVPAEEVATTPPKVPPKDVVLAIDNLTGTPMRLAAYDCALHYQGAGDGSKMRSRWKRFPLDAGPTRQAFPNRFTQGSGWFVLYAEVAGKPSIYLGTKNLFDQAKPLLTITNGGVNEPPYKAELRFFAQ